MMRVLLCGLVLWLQSSTAVRGDDAEDKAVAFVEKLGGKITRAEEVPGKPVLKASLIDCKISDVGLKELLPLRNLTWLDLTYTSVNRTHFPSATRGYWG